MAATTVRGTPAGRRVRHRHPVIPGLRSAPRRPPPSIPRGRVRSRPGLCRPGSTPCAALARRGRSQHRRLGSRVRLPPAAVLGVPRQARRTTSRTHAGPTTCSHPASRRLLDNALPRSPLRAVNSQTAATHDPSVRRSGPLRPLRCEPGPASLRSAVQAHGECGSVRSGPPFDAAIVRQFVRQRVGLSKPTDQALSGHPLASGRLARSGT